MKKHTPQSGMASLFDGKACTKCRKWYPMNGYYVAKKEHDGRQDWCKACHSDHNKAYRLANLEESRAQQKRSREKDPVKTAEYFRKWKEANPERLSHIRRRWRDKHRELYYYTQSVRNSYKQGRKPKLGQVSFNEWIELCAHYDNRCLKCGERKPLTLDHVIPLSKGGTNTIDNCQPLCKSCNSGKKDRQGDYRPK
jgi:5-methylcytosine-specific restriction endonuclease McrA